MPLSLFVGWVGIQVSPERQRIGDFLAGTWVLLRLPRPLLGDRRGGCGRVLERDRDRTDVRLPARPVGRSVSILIDPTVTSPTRNLFRTTSTTWVRVALASPVEGP